MIVEFCGLPGCGKSTLISYCNPNPKYALNRTDLFNRVRYSSQFYRFFPDCFFFGRDNDIIKQYVKEYPLSNDWFNRMLYRLNHALIHSANKTIILEEGPLQYITSVPFDHNINVDVALRNVVALLCQKEALVFKCECPIDFAIDRIQKRRENGYTNNGRYDVSDNKLLYERLKIKESNINTVLGLVSCKVICIDMTLPLEDNAKIVIDSVNSITKHSIWF